ncbi:unnamed protein product [Pneumocystis jirovecii]|uniref:Uncharacterized protein n=1 Tax=Pneumocystis jirovecii TaxID=42068 RepID=L0PB45_PNEJI|nr:unnamed protein product [Pneumocystis jirovecii]
MPVKSRENSVFRCRKCGWEHRVCFCAQIGALEPVSGSEFILGERGPNVSSFFNVVCKKQLIIMQRLWSSPSLSRNEFNKRQNFSYDMIEQLVCVVSVSNPKSDDLSASGKDVLDTATSARSIVATSRIKDTISSSSLYLHSRLSNDSIML